MFYIRIIAVPADQLFNGYAFKGGLMLPQWESAGADHAQVVLFSDREEAMVEAAKHTGASVAQVML